MGAAPVAAGRSRGAGVVFLQHGALLSDTPQRVGGGWGWVRDPPARSLAPVNPPLPPLGPPGHALGVHARALLPLLLAAPLLPSCGEERERATAPPARRLDLALPLPAPLDATSTLDARAQDAGPHDADPDSPRLDAGRRADGAAEAPDGHANGSDAAREPADAAPHDASVADVATSDAAPDTCGDGVCQPAETCQDCPGDCPVCCGDGQCLLRDAESCVTCEPDCACGSGQYCDPPLNRCVVICIPQCSGRVCGADLCGGSCGDCAEGELCELGRCR